MVVGRLPAAGGDDQYYQVELIEDGVEEKEGSGAMSLLNMEGDDNDEFDDQMYREKVPGWWCWYWVAIMVMVVVRILDHPWLTS